MTTLRFASQSVIAVAVFGSFIGAAESADAQQGIFVNGVRVVQEDFVRELARFGVPMTVDVPDGAYWYDRMSGLWGI
jgi:hypothetical protein